jgi:pimeloyl-ACP methyl ester carboxylesterase
MSELAVEMEAVPGVDGPVHFADYGGPGAPMVAVHGIGGSWVNWYLIAPLLRPHVRLLAIDLVGFGLTPLAGRHATIDANQRLLDDFMKRVVGEPCELMGHSMGGLISMLQTGRQPGSVRRLVLLDPAVPPSDESTPVFPAWLSRAMFRRPRVASAVASAFAMLAGPRVLVKAAIGGAVSDFAALNPSVLDVHTAMERERLRRGLAYVGYVEARESFTELWRDVDAFDHAVLDAVQAPTLAFAGEEDTVIPVPSLRRAAERRSDWHWEFLPGIGHDPNFECPELVAASVLDHVATATTT